MALGSSIHFQSFERQSKIQEHCAVFLAKFLNKNIERKHLYNSTSLERVIYSGWSLPLVRNMLISLHMHISPSGRHECHTQSSGLKLLHNKSPVWPVVG